MLPASYFDGSRLNAYLQILKEFEQSSVSEVAECPENTLVVELQIAKDETNDNDMKKVVALFSPEEVMVNLEGVQCDSTLTISSGPKELVEADSIEYVCKKKTFSKSSDVVVRSKHCSKSFKNIGGIIVVFSCITMKVQEITLSSVNQRSFVLEREEKEDKRILARIRELLNTKKMFPGTEFSGIKRLDLPLLKSCRYVCAQKLDGVRYLMYVEKGKTYFVNRSSHLFRGNFDFSPDESFLLDGEMISGCFFVFDALLDKRTKVHMLDFENRVLCFQSIVDRMNCKDFFCCQDFHPLAEARKLFNKSVDGLVLIPIDPPYCIGFSRMMFKFKRGFDTLDLKVCKDGNSKVLKSVKYLPHKQIQYIFFCKAHGIDAALGKVIEVRYFRGNWIYVRDRDDRLMPNSMQVADEVRQEVANPVDIYEFLAACGVKSFG